MALQGITGVPMVASSPIRHDGAPMGVGMGGPLDVTAYQPPWKSLTEFALTHDLDRLDPSTPQYQQLVQQVSKKADMSLLAPRPRRRDSSLPNVTHPEVAFGAA